MATRTWTSGASTDMNNTANYDGAGSFAADDLVFNATSVINAAATAGITCNSITITNGYTGTWSLAGYTATCAQGFSDDGITGAHNYGNGITCKGASATFHVGSGVGTVTATSCDITMNGTTAMVLDDDKGLAAKSLTLGASAVVTNSGAVRTTYLSAGTPLVIGASGSLTANRGLVFYNTTAGTDMYTLGAGYTLNGTAGFEFYAATNAGTYSIPALVFTTGTSIQFRISGNVAVTFSITGTLNVCPLVIYNDAATGTVTLNTNNNAVTATSVSWGSSSASTGDFIANCGSSVFSIGAYGSASYNTRGTINFSTSQWTCTGNWTFGSNHTVDAGTSTVMFTTNNATITSNGKAFHIVVTNGPTRTYTLGDWLFCYSYTVTAGSINTASFYAFQSSAATTNIWAPAADGTWNTAGNWSLGHVPTSGEDVLFKCPVNFACTIDISPSFANLGIQSCYSGNITLSGQTLTVSGGLCDFGTGTRNYGNGLTANGNSRAMGFASSLGTVIATSCVLTFNGTTAMGLYDNKSITFSGLVIGANAVLTNAGTSTSTLQGTAPITFVNGGSVTTTRRFIAILTATGSFITILAGTPTWVQNDGSYVFFSCGAASITASMPAMSFTGSQPILIRDSAQANCTLQLTGNLSTLTGVGNIIIISFTATSGSGTFNSNNYSISCGELQIGANHASGTPTHTINMGSSVVSCVVFNGSANNKACNINLQSSTWTVTGSWTFGSLTTISEGTSLVTFSGTAAAQTVTSSGKKFYDVIINKTATAGVTFADPTSLHTLTVSATNSQAISWTGTTMTASADIMIDGTGTTVFGTSIVMNGASGTLHCGSILGAITGTSCSITMNGTTGMIIDDNKGYVVRTLTLGANAIVTNTGTASSNYAFSTSPLIFTNGGALTFTTRASFRLTADGSLISILGAAPTITNNATASIRFESGATNVDITIPGLTIGGTSAGGIIFIDYSVYAGTTFTLAGNFSNAGGQTGIYCANASGVTFSTGNFNMILGAFNIGLNNAGASGVFNFGSSVISCSSFTSATYNAGGATLNFGSSTWSCNGNWNNGSNHTVNAGTSTVTIINTSTVTPNSKSFYNFGINAAAKTVTIAGDITFLTGGGFTMTAGTLSAGVTYAIFAGSGSITMGTACSWRLRTAVAGSTITWNTGGNVWTVPAYVAADWQGAPGNRLLWRSSAPGSHYHVAIPGGGITLQHVDFQDCNFLIGAATANDGTSITRGNNANFHTFNVVSIAPNNGPAAGGTAITLTDTGNGFGGTCTVMIGIAPAAGETIVDTQNLTATTTAGIAGAQNVVVTNGDGDSYTIVGGFTYGAVPVGSFKCRAESRPWVGASIGI